MSKVSKIDQVHITAVMLCMLKMSKMGKEHTHTFLYRVCDMSKVSEMSISFSLNVILSMSKMSKIDQIHAMYVEDVKDIKTSHNRFLTDFLEFIPLLSEMLKMCMNYNVDSNTKSLNYSKIRFKPLIYFELE